MTAAALQQHRVPGAILDAVKTDVATVVVPLGRPQSTKYLPFGESATALMASPRQNPVLASSSRVQSVSGGAAPGSRRRFVLFGATDLTPEA